MMWSILCFDYNLNSSPVIMLEALTINVCVLISSRARDLLHNSIQLVDQLVLSICAPSTFGFGWLRKVGTMQITPVMILQFRCIVYKYPTIPFERLLLAL